ncbi:MAG: hypothetical protein KIT69_17280 [Propionibacteriaceae bacterium]|nr:hypothetical protein [Propionibacteriaceae bacterium]
MTPQRHRAWRLLRGGLLGLLVAAVPALLLCWLLAGPAGLAAGGGAAGVVLAFFALGQALQLAVADASPRIALFVALASYALRVVLLGILLSAALHAPTPSGLPSGALLGSTLAATLGWITGEVIAFTRLRIPVFDSTQSVPPPRDAR